MNKFRANFLYQFSYQILAILLPLITAPYVSRVLGANGIGEYAYTNTVAYYFYVLCMSGIDTHGQRVVASNQTNKRKRSEKFWEIYAFQVIITLAGSVIYWAYVFFFSKEKLLLSALQYFYVASAFANIIWLFEGVEEFKKIATRNIVMKLFSVFLIFLCVHDPEDLWIYTLIMSGSIFASNLLFIWYAKDYIRICKIHFRSVLKHVKPIFLVFIPQIGITVFMNMDKLMLGWWSSMRELGYYQNAEKIINIPIALILTVGTVMMPRIVSMKAENQFDKVREYLSASMKALIIGGIGCMFGIIAVADDFVPLFFGKDFVDSVSILCWLSITILFMSWENVLQKQYLIPFERDKIVAFAMMAAAVVNCILNAILIPKYGAVGAIIGSIAAHVFICALEGFVVRKELPVFSFIKESIPFIVAGLIMAVLVKLISKYLISGLPVIKILIEIFIGAVIYIWLGFLISKKQGLNWKEIF